MPEYPTLIANHPVLSALTAEDQQGLNTSGLKRRFQRGQFLAYAGDIWPNLFLVGSGRVQALKESSEGRSLVVTSFGTGDLFWGLAFFYDGMPMPAGLKADEDCEAIIWNREQALPAFLRSGEASWELSRLMILKMTRASEVLEEITFQPVAGRLAKLLLDTTAGAAEGPVARNLTLDEMAARIGSTREMVCRFLHKFADDGMIDITRTEFSVTDRQRLGGMAGTGKSS